MKANNWHLKLTQMKIEKNKVVFAIVIVSVVVFIAAYSIMMLGGDKQPTIKSNQIPVPKLEAEQKQYKSKLEALDDLKEVRQTNAPSIYDERLLDSTGVYDPKFLEKKKMRMVDSIYRHGRIDYSNKNYRVSTIKVQPKQVLKDSVPKIEENNIVIDVKELALEHQLFFASNPIKNDDLDNLNTDAFIYVRVDGTQTVKNNFRLQMQLIKDARINNVLIKKHTLIYGFVSFKPNRVIISISNINHRPVKLKAYDLQDGSEGIYIENSFRAEARKQILGDAVNDVNIAGVPQVSGIKKLFQRSNRNVKVTISNNYKLILSL